MAVLGKRKASEPSVAPDDAEEIFRKHFEAQFQPLGDSPDGKEKQKSSRKSTVDPKDGGDASDSDEDLSADEGDDSSEEEWGGLSSDDEAEQDDAPVVEVVDHSSSNTPKATSMSKHELRAFMSSRPPDQTSTRSSDPQEQKPSTTSSDTLPEDAPSLLAQDLELRRLLSESHLLNPSSISSSSPSSLGAEPKPFASGRVRQRATDLRIQSLGSKTSILAQEKMPMSIRKGIVAAGEAREAKRRREARENGIILERPAAGKKKKERKRDFGLDQPGMGRFRGAELRLDDRAVRGLENSRDAFGRRSGGGGGRGGRGGRGRGGRR